MSLSVRLRINDSLCCRRWLVVIVVCASVDNRTALDLIDIGFFLLRGSAVVWAIRRNWNRVSSDWQIAVYYCVCPSLITVDLLIRARICFGILKPCRETYWISLSDRIVRYQQRRLGSWIFIATKLCTLTRLQHCRILSEPAVSYLSFYLLN